MSPLFSKRAGRSILAAIGAASLLFTAACSTGDSSSDLPDDISLKAAILSAEDGPGYKDAKQEMKELFGDFAEAENEAGAAEDANEDDFADDDLDDDLDELNDFDDESLDSLNDYETTTEPEECSADQEVDGGKTFQDLIDEDEDTSTVEISSFDLVEEDAEDNADDEAGADEEDLGETKAVDVTLSNSGEMPEESWYEKCSHIVETTESDGYTSERIVDNEMLDVDIDGVEEAFAVRALTTSKSESEFLGEDEYQGEPTVSVFIKMGKYVINVAASGDNGEEIAVDYANKQVEKIKRVAAEQSSEAN